MLKSRIQGGYTYMFNSVNEQWTRNKVESSGFYAFPPDTRTSYSKNIFRFILAKWELFRFPKHSLRFSENNIYLNFHLRSCALTFESDRLVWADACTHNSWNSCIAFVHCIWMNGTRSAYIRTRANQVIIHRGAVDLRKDESTIVRPNRKRAKRFAFMYFMHTCFGLVLLL